MSIKIEFEVKDLEELEILESGLRFSAEDAREYHSACTPNNKEDREDLAYWDHRAKLLKRMFKETTQVREGMGNLKTAGANKC